MKNLGIEKNENDNSTSESSCNDDEPSVYATPGSSLSLTGELSHSFTSFYDVVNSSDFIDKSLLIKTFLEDTVSRVVVTAPSGFGKTSNINMLKTFLQIVVDENGNSVEFEYTKNYKLFAKKEFKISKYLKFFITHLGNYPVIHLNLQCDQEISNIIEKLKERVYEAFQEHKYLLQSRKLEKSQKNILELYFKTRKPSNIASMGSSCLQFLIEILNQHFNRKVVVLIDAYDSPILQAISKMDKNILSIYRTLVQTMHCLNHKSIERVYITGTHNSASECFHSLNDLKLYQFWEDHPYVPFHGLSPKEVTSLLAKLNTDCSVGTYVYMCYKGYYNLDKSDAKTLIYNTFSVINAMKKTTEEFEDACQKTINQLNLERVFKQEKNAELANILRELCKQQSSSTIAIIKNNPPFSHMKHLEEIFDVAVPELYASGEESVNLFLSFLLEIGVFTIDRSKPRSVLPDGDQIVHVKLANTTIQLEMMDSLGMFQS